MTRASAIQQITKQDILWAIARIKKQGHVPKRRNSRGYSFRHERLDYPPKYLIALAAKRATGRELKPNEHSGGKADSNKVLLNKLKSSQIVPYGSNWPER